MAFVSPIRVSTPLVNRPTRVCKQRPVCVDSPPKPTPAAAPLKKKSQLQKGKYYHVIDPKQDPSTLPPPPPVHYSVPYFGVMLESMLGLSTPASRASKYGDLYRSNFFFNDFLYVTKMEPMNDLLKDSAVFSSNVKNEKFAFFIGPDGLLFKDGPPHVADRNKIAPAFSPTMFSLYFHELRATTERFWERIAKLSEEKQLKLDPELRQFYMSITIELTTGVNADSELCRKVKDLFMTMIDGMMGPMFGPIWDRSVRARAEIVQILTDVIHEKLVNEAETIEQIRENIHDQESILNVKDLLKHGADILQVLLAGLPFKTGPNQAYDPVEFEKLVDLLLLLWSAGFFTTAATTSCAMFEMGFNKEIMRRLVAEQDEITSRANTKQLQYEQLERMPLLDSYMKEIMRMYPAGNGILRNVEQDVVLLGKKVTKGTTLFFDLAAAMRDESIYPNPDTLVMDRFVKKDDGSDPPPRIIAFGGKGSPHFCVGAALAKMMMKTNMAEFLRNYQLQLDPNQSKKYLVMPVISPESEVLVKAVTKRM